MNPFVNFLIRLMLYSLVIGLLFFFAEPYLPAKVAFPGYWWIQLIIICVTIGFHYGLTRSVKAGGQTFIRYFMGATSLKLMVFMMVMIVYGLLNKESAFGFILHFFIFYLFYTIFEVAVAYKYFGPARTKE